MSASLKNRRMWCERTSELTLHNPQLHKYPASRSGYWHHVTVTICVTDRHFILTLSWSTAGGNWHGHQSQLHFPNPSRSEGLEITHHSYGDNNATPALPRGLSRVLTQHGGGFILHGAPLWDLAAARAADAAAGIPLWMWMSSPRWLSLPVQLAAGNNSDNTNSHWSAISILLSADYGGGLWPRAVLCGGPMSGPTRGQSNQNILCKVILFASWPWVQLNSDAAVYGSWKQLIVAWTFLEAIIWNVLKFKDSTGEKLKEKTAII